MDVKVNDARARDMEHDVEHGIWPRFGQAVTLPVVLDGEQSDVSIYIGSSAFAVRRELTDEEFWKVVEAIRLGLEVGGLL